MSYEGGEDQGDSRVFGVKDFAFVREGSCEIRITGASTRGAKFQHKRGSGLGFTDLLLRLEREVVSGLSFFIVLFDFREFGATIWGSGTAVTKREVNVTVVFLFRKSEIKKSLFTKVFGLNGELFS